jgi:hypothetical protein
MLSIKINQLRPADASVSGFDTRTFADVHGAVQCVERCRRCGALGVAHYAPDGWGFEPRQRCGDPLKCGDKPNINAGPFLHIVGGRP